jgi:glycosyltransferase involved in cell wall biosynthesis
MKTIYIHQYFTTNKGKTGTRSYDVAKYMVQAGHEVNMICGVHKMSGLDPMPWYRLFRRENVDGIKVISCNVKYSNSMGSMGRMWAFIWFVILATIAACCIRKPDIVFATSTPIFVGIPGYIAAKLKRASFIFEVRDLWPESFIHAGWATGDELYIKVMGWLEKFLYKHAAKILLVSSGFKDNLIKRGYPEEKLKVILLGAAGEIFKQIEPNLSFLDKYDLQNKKIAIFTGAHGKANGLDYVLDAAELSKDREDITYVLIGDGGEKPRLMKRAEQMGLKNIVFANAVEKMELPGILAVCYIGLMILRDIGPRPVTPNKIFDYMFTGLPSIVNFKGPTIDMVKADGSGVFADPTKPQELVNQVEFLVDNPEEAVQMGERGKNAAWKKYDRRIISQQLVEMFEEVLQANSKK